MLIRRIYHTLRSATAVQDEWFPHVRRNLSLDLKRFWRRLTDSHQCFWVCSYACRRTKKRTAKYWKREMVKDLNHSNGHVSCINSHSFALGILLDGQQKIFNLSDGLYTVSVNSTSFQVSAIRQWGKISIIWMRIFYLNRISWHRFTVCEVLRGSPRKSHLHHCICKQAPVLLQILLTRRNVRNPHTVCNYLGILAPVSRKSRNFSCPFRLT